MNKIWIKITNSIKRVRFYWQDYFKSMLFLQGLKTIIILPILSGIFILMLQRAKIVGLTDETIMTLLHTPSALILGLLWLLIFTYAIFYELGYYFLMADSHLKGYKANYKENFKKLNKKIKYFFSSHLVLFLGYFLLILPLVSLGFQSDLLETIKIPDFIVDELSMTLVGSILISLAGIFILYLSFRLLYVIYFFVITPSQTILSAIKESWEFSKGRLWRNVCIIGTLILLIGATLAGTIFMMTLPLMLTDFIMPKLSPIVAGIVITGIQLVLFFVGGLLQPLLANGVVETTREEITPFSVPLKKISNLFMKQLRKKS
ncbi:glycerophosphoryl diester phosphodiesterase membrane domain-containing protein [Vagococcus intermedius]|uniref:Glycerophosphoryl diester phosphodiesterase membrane domain-containing protein n=1 Tax=Vagococcus intermedius TaxID=2991418 RepID=A0AAF0I6A7_9ENTE|nr:glycerophosphoryl diester phosphodiesterase membrane domain-containing protein [Vagococcus intermedius]WEG72659.1 glycerophosphoryl diester phosphodiesterase membrane domain-containing protein [Vagococcus intermedius]WEG74744.1 glycerophosphoryl diester phosphodiesterase membrane domain-containing protein [Vagococcus intermedius]